MMMMTMGSVFTGVVCPVKIGGESFDLQPYQNSPPPFFTGRMLRPPGIGIEATAAQNLTVTTRQNVSSPAASGVIRFPRNESSRLCVASISSLN